MTSFRPLLGSIFLLASVLPGAAPAQVSRNVTLLAHLNQHPGYSACWSYVHPDGREYAILGTTDGTAIVNVTNPSAPYEVAFIGGLPSQWREMKQYQTYVYVSTEATGGGIQVIDMSNPEAPLLLGSYTGSFNHEHTLEVDATRALLYANGTRMNSLQTGMHILSIDDPENPVDLGAYTTDYVHDCFPRGDTLFASCISSNTMRVLDVSNPASISEIASWTYPGAKTHSAETSLDGNYLYICDETNYGTMKIFDIRNLVLPQKIMEITVNPLAIVHNVHVKADTAFVAYYTEGIRLFDISDPAYPAEFGYYDTYAGYSGGFHGVWELAPRFPSGTFIASDITSGLYVFRSNPDYGTIKVRVVDPNQFPIVGADVTALGETDSTRTQATGMVRLALGPGAHTIGVKKFGYRSSAFFLGMAKGAHDSVTVVLQPEPLASLTGVVRRGSDGASLEWADIDLMGSPLSVESNGAGGYSLSGVPGGTYTLACDRVGYVPIERQITVQPGVSRTVDFSLQKAAWYDSCDTDKGWSLFTAGDDAFSGSWERADPVGTSGSAAPAGRPGAHLAVQHDEPAEGLTASGPVQPEDDHTPGGGGFCFVTGNGIAGRPPADSDVDGGRTTLTTPALDMSGMTDPHVHFARWYYMNSPGEPDSMLFEISPDGASWVRVETTRTSEPFWKHEAFRVRDFITPGPSVRFRFIAQDQAPEGIVEAAVDDFEFYDGGTATATADTPPPVPELTVSAPRPNPASKSATLTLALPRAAHARVAVYDFSGREVRVLLDRDAQPGTIPVVWDGRNSRGGAVGSGVYWIRAIAAGRSFERKVVWVR